MTDERKREIKKIAKDVHIKAEEFQLSHAVLACGSILDAERRNRSKERYAAITKKAVLARKNNEYDTIKDEIDKERNQVQCEDQRQIVYVEHFVPKTVGVPRAVRYEEGLFVLIPNDISEACKPQMDGSYNVDAIKSLRDIMGHELGHIMLHRDKIKRNSITHDLNNEEDEEEAELFKKELLEYRNERYKNLNSQRAFIKIYNKAT